MCWAVKNSGILICFKTNCIILKLRKQKKTEHFYSPLFFQKTLGYPKQTPSATSDMLLTMMTVSSFISKKCILHLQEYNYLGNNVTLNELKPTYTLAL